MRVASRLSSQARLRSATRHAADVDPPVDDVEHHLDPARHPVRRPVVVMSMRWPADVASVVADVLVVRMRGQFAPRPRASPPCGPACPPGTSRAPRPNRRHRASARSGRRPRSPGGRTPNRLPSTAISDLAFISPNPGRPSRRFSRSGPSTASRPDAAGVVAVVRGDRRAQRLDLAAIDPGSGGAPGARGRRRRARPGPSPRSAPRSRWPSRRLSSAGPLNAFWTVTCWSSANPIEQGQRVLGEQAVGLGDRR